jgi:hypothetical protein
MVYTQEHLNEQIEETQKKCAAFVESFAAEYVEKWVGTTGDSAKAAGWAILQAAIALRKANI